eukprot:COSAG01_NODE_6027_length_3892_cov_4.819668_1_plen_1266_part_01
MFLHDASLLWYRNLDDAHPEAVVPLTRVHVSGLSIMVDAATRVIPGILPGECILISPLENLWSAHERRGTLVGEHGAEQASLDLQLQWVTLIQRLKRRPTGIPRLPAFIGRTEARKMLLDSIFGTIRMPTAFSVYKEMWHKCLADHEAVGIFRRLHQQFIALAGEAPHISKLPEEECSTLRVLKLALSDLTTAIERAKLKLTSAHKKVAANQHARRERALTEAMTQMCAADELVVSRLSRQVPELEQQYEGLMNQHVQEVARVKQAEAALQTFPRNYANTLCEFMHLCCWSVCARAIFYSVTIKTDLHDSRSDEAALARFDGLLRAVSARVEHTQVGWARLLLARLEHPAADDEDALIVNPSRAVHQISDDEIEWARATGVGQHRYEVILKAADDPDGEFCAILALFDPVQCPQYFHDVAIQEDLVRAKEQALATRDVPTNLRRSPTFQRALTEVVFGAEDDSSMLELWNDWVLAPEARSTVDQLYLRFTKIAGELIEPTIDSGTLEQLNGQLDAKKAEQMAATNIGKDSCIIAVLQQERSLLQDQVDAEQRRIQSNKADFQVFVDQYAQAFLNFVLQCSRSVALRSFFLAFSIEIQTSEVSATTTRSSCVLSQRGVRSDLAMLDEDTVAARAREFGISADEIEDCQFEDNPVESLILKIESVVSNMASSEEVLLRSCAELELLGGAALLKRAREEGVEEKKIAGVKSLKGPQRKAALIQAILDASTPIQAIAPQDSAERVAQGRTLLEGWFRTFNYISEKINGHSSGGWAQTFLELLQHPSAEAANPLERILPARDESIWLSRILDKRYTIVLGSPAQYGGEFERLGRIFGDTSCLLFFLEHAYRTTDTQRLIELMRAVDVHAVQNGRAFDATSFVPFVIRLERQHQVEVLRDWHEVRALTNTVFAALVDEAMKGRDVDVILKTLAQVLLVSDDADISACNEAPQILLRAMDTHIETLGLSDSTFLLFELVLRFSRSPVFSHVCDSVMSDTFTGTPVYLSAEFLQRFEVYFRTVCQENQDAGTGQMARMTSISDKSRDENQISASILGFLKLLWFTSHRGCGMELVHNFFSGCGEYMFQKHLRVGSVLLSEVVSVMRDDLPSEAQLLPEIAAKLLDTENPIPFSPVLFAAEVQELVTNSVLPHARGMEEYFFSAVHVTLRLIDVDSSILHQDIGSALYRRVLSMLNPVPSNRLIAQRHLRTVLDRLQTAHRDELQATPNSDGAIAVALTIEDISECIRSAVTAIQSLQGCPADAMEVMNTYFAHT